MRQILLYVLFDALGSTAAWLCLNFGSKASLLADAPSAVLYGWGAAYVLLWAMLSLFMGFYHAPFRRARLNELVQTIAVNMLGSMAVLLWALACGHADTLREVAVLGGLIFAYQTLFTYPPRLLLTWSTIGAMERGELVLPTLVVGPEFALRMLQRRAEFQRGFSVVGSLQLPSMVRSEPNANVATACPPVLGTSLDELPQIVEHHHIANVVVASSITALAFHVSARLLSFERVDIYALMHHRDNLRTTSIHGPLLYSLRGNPMPHWQRMVKRLADYALSIMALVLLSPLLLIMVLIIRLTSPGPAIYRQERVGRYGRPFTIYKLRSMRMDAEADGPALSSRTDRRVTPIGRFMRRTHIDELPNFVNVLKGDMSLVGPRPERQHYIDQIMRRSPDYALLLSLRPGITSWGQVKYGYAENVSQMLQRLRYDKLYLDNRSLLVDAKILIYTMLTVLKGAWG